MKKFDKNPLTDGAPNMEGSPMSAPLEPTTMTPEPEVTPWKDQPAMSPRPQPRPAGDKPRVINADQLLGLVDEMAALGQPIPAELQIEVDKIKAHRHAEASAKGATASREAPPMMDFTKSMVKTDLSLDDIEVLDQATDMQAQRVTLSNMDDLLHEMRALQVFAMWHRLPTSSQAVETVEQVHPEAEVLLGRVMAVITEVIRNNGLDGEAVEAECRKRVDVLRHARSQQGR